MKKIVSSRKHRIRVFIKGLIFLSYFVFTAKDGYSQGFLGKRPLIQPENCLRPKKSYTYKNLENSRASSYFWYVWADRDNITTTTGKNLNFLDKFLAVDKTEDKIHIVRDNGSFDNSLGEFRSEPEDMGWVEKDKMLLWASALYSDKTNFRIKIMTITTPDIIKKRLTDIESEADKLSFYNSPTTTIPNEIRASLFEIFYVLKTSEKRFLVSKKDDISRGTASDYILGWVDTNQVQVWDHRQAIEPNWDVNAALERQTNHIPASLFGNKYEAEGYQQGLYLEKAIWNSDPYSTRNDPYWKRFPVFQKEDDMFYTAVVSDMINASDVKTTATDMAKLEKLINEHRAERRNVNVVFVIDGTESMKNYMEPVRKGVQNSVIQLQSSENKYKFGAVIYRDYDDPDNDKCYEVFSLTSDAAKFSDYIINVKTDDPACYNKTMSEGMYHGIYKACRQLFSGKDKETNLIILLGDCGDREGPNRTGPSKIIDYITRYHVNFLALQVHSGENESYGDFIRQISDLIRDAAEKMVDNQNMVYRGLQLKGLGDKPRFEQGAEGDLRQYYLINSPITGGIRYTIGRETIEASSVAKEVEKMILESNEKNNALLKQIEFLFYSNRGDTTGSFTPEIMTFLQGAGLTPEQIQIMSRKNYQFLMESYTAYKVQKINSAIYNFVLFLDTKELDDLIRTLNRMFVPNSMYSEIRQDLQDTWLQVLRTNYGVTREEISNKTISQLMEMVTGLPSANPLLKEYTYDDLGDANKLPIHTLTQIIEYCKVQARQLESCRSNEQFYFKSNDRAFYWIPHSYIP